MESTGAIAPSRARRAPWTLWAGGIAWIVSGLLFVGAPVIAILLTRAQTDSLTRKIDAFSESASAMPGVTAENIEQLRTVLRELTNLANTVWDGIADVFMPLVIAYIVLAVIVLGMYLLFSVCTIRGMHWARVLSTILCVLCTLAAIVVWASVASLSFLPLDALWANSLGLALIVLQSIGLVLVWLPPSNAYVRARRAARRTPIPSPATA